jgi:hypothetical protein
MFIFGVQFANLSSLAFFSSPVSRSFNMPYHRNKESTKKQENRVLVQKETGDVNLCDLHITVTNIVTLHTSR